MAWVSRWFGERQLNGLAGLACDLPGCMVGNLQWSSTGDRVWSFVSSTVWVMGSVVTDQWSWLLGALMVKPSSTICVLGVPTILRSTKQKYASYLPCLPIVWINDCSKKINIVPFLV